MINIERQKEIALVITDFSDKIFSDRMKLNYFSFSIFILLALYVFLFFKQSSITSSTIFTICSAIGFMIIMLGVNVKKHLIKTSFSEVTLENKKAKYLNTDSVDSKKILKLNLQNSFTINNTKEINTNAFNIYNFNQNKQNVVLEVNSIMKKDKCDIKFDNLVFNDIDLEDNFINLIKHNIIETDLENFKQLIEQKRTNRKIVLIDKDGGYNKNQQITYIRLFFFFKDVLIKEGFVYSKGITLSEKNSLVQFICSNFEIPNKNGLENEPLKPKNVVSALRRFNP